MPGAWVELDVTDATPYRYVRFLSPKNSYGSLYEVEFYTSEKLNTTLLQEKLAEPKTAMNALDQAEKDMLARAVEYTETALANGISQLEANALYSYLYAALENAEAGSASLVTGGLEAVLAKAARKNENQYASKGFVTLRKLAASAETLLASSDASQKELNDAMLTLSLALGKLTGNAAKITGTLFGNGGEYTAGHDYTKFFDGDTNTYVNFASPGTGSGGIDIGEGNRVSLAYLRYYPRYAENGGALLTRIKSNVFQASVDGEHWTTVGAITENALPQWFTLDVDITESFRYFRIYCPENSYGSLCEVEFYAYTPDTTYWEECVKDAEARSDAALNKFILSSKAMLVSPREHTQKDFNDKVLEYFSLTSESAGRKALIAAQEAFRNANEEKYTSESYLPPMRQTKKPGRCSLIPTLRGNRLLRRQKS